MENRIKDLRNANGVTQKQLSDYLGVKQNTLSYWERGIYDVDNASLQKIADFFGVTMDYLLCHDSSRTTGASANSQMSLTPHERLLILAYRSQPGMREVVDRILNIAPEQEEMPKRA